MTALSERLRAIPSWQVTLGVALLALGFLIAAQLASEGPRVRYTTQERSLLIETITGIQGQQDALKDRILQLRATIQDTELSGRGSAAIVRDINNRLDEARISAGLIALTGSGIVYQLEDSTQPTPPGGNDADYVVTPADIRTVVEELWLAGAEAIAVNGERIVTTSAIVDIGGSILINSAYLAPPYQITALGPDDLYERVSSSQGFIDFLRARAEAFGIQVAFFDPATVSVPAYAGTVTIRSARPLPSGEPAP